MAPIVFSVIGGANVYSLLTWDLIAKDVFTDANSTASNSHAMTKGSGWTQNTGTFYIQSNSLQPNSFADGDLATFDAGAGDGYYKCDLTPFDSGGSASIPGLVFRFSDTSNFWLVQMDSAADTVTLYDNQAGSFTSRLSYGLALTSLTSHTVEVWLKGNTITIKVDGANEATYVSTFNKTATKHGVRCGKSSTPATRCSWDNMEFKAATAPALAWPLFVKSTSNPILTKGSSGSWEETDIAKPSVFFDAGLNTWVMSYSGYSASAGKWKTGLAYNPDITNATGWSKDTHNPIFGPDGTEGTIAADQAIVNFGGTYFLYYQAIKSSKSQICCATSPNLTNGGTWTRQNSGAPVVGVGAGGTWDETGVFAPFVEDAGDGTLRLYYCGSNSGGVRYIGWATSPDGVTFTKQGQLFSNPPFSPIGANMGEPSVAFRQGSTYLISYSAATSSGFRYVNMAEFDGAGFHQRMQAVAPGSGWESVQTFDGFMTLYNGVLYLFYAGAPASGPSEGFGSQIGVASVAWP